MTAVRTISFEANALTGEALDWSDSSPESCMKANPALSANMFRSHRKARVVFEAGSPAARRVRIRPSPPASLQFWGFSQAA
jgi:hypothetical protein